MQEIRGTVVESAMLDATPRYGYTRGWAVTGSCDDRCGRLRLMRCEEMRAIDAVIIVTLLEAIWLWA